MSVKSSWGKLQALIGPEITVSPLRRLPSHTALRAARMTRNSSTRTMKRWDQMRRSSPSPDASVELVSKSASSLRVRKIILPMNKSPNRSFMKKEPEPLAQSEGLTNDQVFQLYAAKCADLKLPRSQHQERRFFEFCSRQIKHRKLVLKDFGLGPISGATIGKVLMFNENFAQIDLSKNHLLDQGVAQLIGPLAENSNLVSINLSSNDISMTGAIKLLQLLRVHPSITSIDISSIDSHNTNRLGILGAQACAKLLQYNPVVSMLNIYGTSIGARGLLKICKGLLNNTSLIMLNIGSNDIGAAPLQQFFTTISYTRIMRLNLSNNKLGNKGTDIIARYLKGEFGFPQVSKLDISQNGISAQGSEAIWIALRVNRNLQNLNLEKNPLWEEGMTGLIATMVTNSSLTHLNMTDCELGWGGVRIVGQSLEKNRGMHSLILGLNAAGNKGAVGMAKMLTNHPSLYHMDLNTNKIEQKGGLALADALRNNSVLRSLNLKDNHLNEVVGEAFIDVCYTNITILKIELAFNTILINSLHTINARLKQNKARVNQRVVPNLKQQIRYLSIRDSAWRTVRGKIQDKEQELSMNQKQLDNHQEVLDTYREKEEEKFQEVKESLAEKQTTRHQQDIDIEEYDGEIRSLKVKREIDLNRLGQDITQLNIDIRKLEQQKSLNSANLTVKRATNEKKYAALEEVKQQQLKSNQYFQWQKDKVEADLEKYKTDNGLGQSRSRSQSSVSHRVTRTNSTHKSNRSNSGSHNRMPSKLLDIPEVEKAPTPQLSKRKLKVKRVGFKESSEPTDRTSRSRRKNTKSARKRSKEKKMTY